MTLKLLEIRSRRKNAKAEALKTEAEATKTGADTVSVEADVFSKTVQTQGSAMDRLLAENQRAYLRADEAEETARATKTIAEAAQEDARVARQEVADLRRDMENFEELIEGYFITHKFPLPEWWPRHGKTDGSAEKS